MKKNSYGVEGSKKEESQSCLLLYIRRNQALDEGLTRV